MYQGSRSVLCFNFFRQILPRLQLAHEKSANVSRPNANLSCDDAARSAFRRFELSAYFLKKRIRLIHHAMFQFPNSQGS